MGSMISLSAGEIHIDWGKNDGFINHASLFQLRDEALAPYHYVNGDGSPHIEERRCLCRPLTRVKPRLELLGYSGKRCMDLFAGWVADDHSEAPVDFDAFREALSSLPWKTPGSCIDFDEEIREAYGRVIRGKGHHIECPSMIAWERFLDPYLVLGVLAEEPGFEDLPVRWNFAEVLDAGWATEEEVTPSAPSRKWVVVTEGSSDTLILQRSLSALLPDVADFFDFIDMKEGNPFPGVGSIVTFCRGLQRIRYEGNMLVVLDNDTAGRGAFKDIQSLGLDTGVKVTCLPDLEELSSFTTLGPNGEGVTDINGRASAIECFLDFDSVSRPAQVRWTSFDRRLNSYQGELIGKEEYSAAFRERFPHTTTYATQKLRRLWSHLIQICTARSTPAKGGA